MIWLYCLSCNRELCFPERLTLGQFKVELGKHGCRVVRVRWSGRVERLMVQ